MKLLAIELKKMRRSGVLPVLPWVGALGAGYAFINFFLRGDALLRLPLEPMDLLLTQLYGLIMVLNMFGLITAACLAYDMEFKGSAVKKLHTLPVRGSGVFLSKFVILTALLAAALILQNLALSLIGANVLPEGTYQPRMLQRFAVYSFETSLPVLSFMLLISSRLENMWLPLGIGVAGFLSAMALANIDSPLLLAYPFAVMLKPAVAMSARPEVSVAAAASVETLLFLSVGLWLADCKRRDI